jgi:hypothetical protein
LTIGEKNAQKDFANQKKDRNFAPLIAKAQPFNCRLADPLN